MFNPFDHCREVSPACPVEGIVLGYAPNLGGNIFFLFIFAICALLQAGLAFRYKTYTFGLVVVLGCTLEAIGYALRTSMHYNVWRPYHMMIQAMFIILSPSFLAVGIYVCLERMIEALGPQHSMIPPRMLTGGLVGVDCVSIVLQAAGGALAFTADDMNMVDIGDNIVVAGMIIGVVVQGSCVAVAVDFGYRTWRSQRYQRRIRQRVMACSWPFIVYTISILVAFVAILIRSIYRVPQLYGGWGNKLMRKEHIYMVLEPSMIALASILLTLAHPGVFFPRISAQSGDSQEIRKDVHQLAGEGDRLSLESSEYAYQTMLVRRPLSDEQD